MAHRCKIALKKILLHIHKVCKLKNKKRKGKVKCFVTHCAYINQTSKEKELFFYLSRFVVTLSNRFKAVRQPFSVLFVAKIRIRCCANAPYDNSIVVTCNTQTFIT